MREIKIFGHKNPDTDSVCSAIALAHYEKCLGIKAIPYVLGEISKETQFVLDYFKVKKPEILQSVDKDDNIMLVDHNEKKQSVDNRDEATILAVIDHHRVTDFHTDAPLYFRSEPVGSTATIIAKMYVEAKFVMPAPVAGLLLSAILSDTLMFTSPTCTNADKAVGEQLAEKLKINIEEYATKMFKEGSELDDMTEVEILNMDCKPFAVNGYDLKIAQVTTLDLPSVKERTDKFLNKMNEICEEENLNMFILAITDLVNSGSEMIVCGKDKHIADKAFDMKPEENSKFLEGILSRKKQIVPMVTDATK